MATDLELMQARIDELIVLLPIVARLDLRVRALEAFLAVKPPNPAFFPERMDVGMTDG